jgi:hypothetical protein
MANEDDDGRQKDDDEETGQEDDLDKVDVDSEEMGDEDDEEGEDDDAEDMMGTKGGVMIATMMMFGEATIPHRAMKKLGITIQQTMT